MNYKKYMFAYLLIVFGLVLAAVGTSFALTYISDTTVNKVSTQKLSVQIVEKYDPPEAIYPSQEIEKIVNIKNTGGVDALVRVRYEKAWGKSRDIDGNLEIDSAFSTDNIIIDINNTYWIDGGDGYYYYKGILEAGQTTLEPLFESFTIDPLTGDEYQGMLGDIIVYTEIIQADYNVIEDVWNKTYEFLGVTPKDTNVDYGKTKVTFISPKAGFDIRESKIDLFTNFKDLIPGSTRTQVIEVCNNYSKEQPVYLKANITEQDTNKRELIEQLLQDLIDVKIMNGDELFYEGPVYGNLHILDEDETVDNNMKYFILLGNIAPNQCRELTLSLSVKKTMGNEYMDLLGNIEWEFLTSYEEENPYTGDQTQLITHITLLVAAVLIIVTSVVFLVKIKKVNKTKIETV